MNAENISDNKKLIEEDLRKRKRIVNDINHSMFVEAGAGAGKTSLVVERIINQLANGVPPENIVVITFTNKAAEELRTRIVDKFMDKLSEIEANSEDYNINHMTISTIHSFCYKMLSERIFDARLKPDAEWLQDDEEMQIKNDFFDSWYARLNNEALDGLNRYYSKKQYIKASVYNIYKELCALPEDVEVVYRSKKEAEIEYSEFEEGINDFKAFVVKVINNYYGTDFATFEESLKDETVVKAKNGKGPYSAYTGDIEKVLKEDDIYSLYNRLVKLVDEEKCGKCFRGKKAELSEPIIAPVAEWVRCNLVPLFEELQYYIHSEITNLALNARSEFWQSDTYRQTITNDTILKRANKLVCENKSAWEYFTKKYKYIYVDEFQDTDDIQSQFIWQLARNAFDSDDKGLRDGALFVVGDPKQSIYRFRAADVTQYFATKEKMLRLKNELNSENVDIYDLDMNFRSNPEVIAWVNKEFCTETTFGSQYRNMLTEKESDLANDKCLQGVYTLTKPTKSKEEPYALCDVILKLTNPNNGFVISEYDKQKKIKERPIEYKDILVLTNDTYTSEYAKALADRGIPVDYTGKIAIATIDAIKKFVMLFSYLVTPKDTRAKCGALNSLREIDDCTEESVKIAHLRLDNLFAETAKMDSYGKALFLAKHIDILLDADINIAENTVISIQKKLRQIIENIFSKPLADNYTLVKYLKAYVGGKVERELRLSPDANVIRFMNVHQAKGLEGNIVIVAKRENEIFRTDSSYRDNTGKTKKYYPFVKLYYSEKGGYPIYADMDIKTRFAHKDACYMDEINLQYVAATRAREALIVMSNLGGENVNTFFRQFNLSQCNRFDSMLECAEIEKNTPSYKEYVYKADTNIANEQTISPFICIKPSDFEKSGTAGKKEASENELDDIQAEETISVEGDDRPKGNIVGNVLHRSYELFVNRWKRDFTIDVDKAIKMCVSQALVENAEDISTEETDSFREFVEKTLKSFTDDEEISQLVKNADKIYTELEFSYMLDKTQAEELLSEIDTKGRFHDYNELWVNGTADLVLVAADGSVVIADYKSDNNSDHLKDFKDRLNKKYENQLKLYKYSIAKLLNVDLNKISTRIVNYEK